MINTTTVTISPKYAKELLELNTNNRPIALTHVDFLAKEIEAGNWKVNGESIKVGKDKLIDGQHRLHAIIQANKSIKTLVSTGLSDEVFDTVDTGRNRTGGDILALSGEKYVNNLNALLLLINRYYEQAQFGHREKISNIKIEQLLEKCPDAREYAGVSPKATGLLPPRIIEFCHYVFAKKDKEAADKFISQLCDGCNLGARNPILTLRNKLMTAKMAGAAFAPTVTICLVFKTWNMARNGKTSTRLQYKSGESIQRAK